MTNYFVSFFLKLIGLHFLLIKYFEGYWTSSLVVINGFLLICVDQYASKSLKRPLMVIFTLFTLLLNIFEDKKVINNSLTITNSYFINNYGLSLSSIEKLLKLRKSKPITNDKIEIYGENKPFSLEDIGDNKVGSVLIKSLKKVNNVSAHAFLLYRDDKSDLKKINNPIGNFNIPLLTIDGYPLKLSFSDALLPDGNYFLKKYICVEIRVNNKFINNIWFESTLETFEWSLASQAINLDRELKSIN